MVFPKPHSRSLAKLGVESMFLDSVLGPFSLPQGVPSSHPGPCQHLRLQVHTLCFQHLVSLENATWSHPGSGWEDVSLIGD